MQCIYAVLKIPQQELNIIDEKMYSNLEKYGNTFCASIPIALDDVFENLKIGDKLILAGYGGGLNLGSILIEK